MSGNDENRLERPAASPRLCSPPPPSSPEPVGRPTRVPLLDVLFRRRTSVLGVQFFRYLFVGGTAAVVDVTLVYLLTFQVGVHYLLSVAVAFGVGSVVNYVGCVLWIFQPGAHRKREFTAFVVVGAVGLLLNETTVWLLHGQAGAALMSAKIAAVILGTFWNFTLRKTLVFREQLFTNSAKNTTGKGAGR
ncbi:GtrA family protein [Streptomyces sp. 4N509B]|uniref:GtrA family protein n=1 Tax=Streptomyces sp. 4N509B TaxID=3457413 RepID=UPI003FD632F5